LLIVLLSTDRITHPLILLTLVYLNTRTYVAKFGQANVEKKVFIDPLKIFIASRHTATVILNKMFSSTSPVQQWSKMNYMTSNRK